MARGINLLHPEVQNLANKLVAECAKKGLKVKITETLRTKQEQNELYAQGRTKPGKIVTSVKYPNSYHNWGVAFDICRNDGKGAYNDNDNWFKKVGEVGKSLGLEWGGDWTKFKDKPHFQYNKFGNTTQLTNKFKEFENFKKTWIQGANYMKTERDYVFDGKTKKLQVISHENVNYIKVKDIADLLCLSVEYNPNTKTTTFKKK